MLSLVVNRWRLRYLGVIMFCFCSAANAAGVTDLKDLLQTEWYWLFRVNEGFDKASLPHLTHAHKLKNSDSIGFGLYTIPCEVAKKGLTIQNLIKAPWSSTHSRFFDWGEEGQTVLPRPPKSYWEREQPAIFPPQLTLDDRQESVTYQEKQLSKINWNPVTKEFLDQIITQIEQSEQGFKKYPPSEQNNQINHRRILDCFIEASADIPGLPKSRGSNSEQVPGDSRLPLRDDDGHFEPGTFFSSKDRDIHILATEHDGFYMLLPHAIVLGFIPGYGQEGASLQNNPAEWGIRNDPAVSERLYPPSNYFPASKRMRVDPSWIPLLSSSFPSSPTYAKRRKLRVTEEPETATQDAGTPSPSFGSTPTPAPTPAPSPSLSPTPSLSPLPVKRSRDSVTEELPETVALNNGEPSLSPLPAKRSEDSVPEEEPETVALNNGEPSLSPPPAKRSRDSVPEEEPETVAHSSGEPSLSPPPAKRSQDSVIEEEHETTIHNTGTISSNTKKD